MAFRDEDDKVEFEDCFGLKESVDGSMLLVQIEGEEMWIPQSAIHDDSEVYRKDSNGTLVVMRWFAKRKGLVDE